MSEWKEYKLGDIASFSYGKLPKHDLLGKGCYVTFSGYKYIERYPEYNCEKGDVVLVARGVGGTGDVKLTTQRCFLTNLSIKIDQRLFKEITSVWRGRDSLYSWKNPDQIG